MRYTYPKTSVKLGARMTAACSAALFLLICKQQTLQYRRSKSGGRAPQPFAKYDNV